MTDDTRQLGGSQEDERYIHDYEAVLTKQIVGGRTADVHGAFFLPYLHSGMSLLDCGCGPGTITMGLAKAVAPGEVVGIDIEPSQINLALSNAEELGIFNVRFEVASVYRLPFPDKTFDVVFSHATLAHLGEPVTALKEAQRVLKPGGIIGVRDCDWDGFLLTPTNATLDEAFKMYFRFRQHNGGDPFIGKRLRGLFREAGFVNAEGSASYECWGTRESVKSVADVIRDELTGPNIAKEAIELGWADQARMDETAISITEWSEHPDALLAHTWCEAVGRKR